MCEWAEHQFKLNKTDKDGISEREHLEQVEKQTGRRIEALESPTEFPQLLSHVWSAFCRLSNSRSAGFSGPNSISYLEIQAWKEVTGTPLKSWEVEAVKRLDAVYLGVAHG